MTKSAQGGTGLNCINFFEAFEKEKGNFLKDFPNTKLGKQLKLINMLAYEKPKPIDRIASLMEKSTKQIKRDLAALEAFFVIDYKDKKPFICIDSSKNHAMQMSISASEARHIIQHLLGSNQSLSRSLCHKLSFYIDEGYIQYHQQDNLPEKISTVELAIRENQQIALVKYRSSNSGKIANRKLEPISIEAGVYLVAYDLASKTTKVFHLERAEQVIQLEKQYVVHEEEHQFLKPDLFLMFGLNPTPVELLLTTKAANILKEQYPLAATLLKEERHFDQLKYRLQVEINDYHGIGRFVVGLLHDVEIVKDNGLKNYVQEYINAGINRLQQVG